MIPKYIKTSSDLVTPAEKTVEGFLKQALLKSGLVLPIIRDAKSLKLKLRSVRKKEDLLNIVSSEPTRDAIINAAGFSDKAKSHMSPENMTIAAVKVLEDIFQNDREDFADQVVYRYLLTRGDSLGGSVRNIVGSVASTNLSNLVIRALEQKGITVSVATTAKPPRKKITMLRWKNRIILFDVTPPFLEKNVDLILLDSKKEEGNPKKLLLDLTAYLACGELKGGIDPAGADEHWKTARSALNRIRDASEKRNMLCPALFYVGSAIEQSMAEEIFNNLADGKLTHAANLTKPEQLADLVGWLVSL
jgi:hypothetical protein